MPDLSFCQVWVCWCGAPFLTRGRVYRLRLLLALDSAVILGRSPARLMMIFYCLRFETVQSWTVRSSYLSTKEQDGPVTPLFVFSYDSLDYGGGIRTHPHMEWPQQIQVILRQVSGPYLGPMTRFFITVGNLRSSCYGAPSLRRGLVCNLLVQFAVTLRSKPLRTHGHILLSYLRLPQSGGPGHCIYLPPGPGLSSYNPGHWVPFLSPLTVNWRTYNISARNLHKTSFFCYSAIVALLGWQRERYWEKSHCSGTAVT
jgi:hypothetical protein